MKMVNVMYNETLGNRSPKMITGSFRKTFALILDQSNNQIKSDSVGSKQQRYYDSIRLGNPNQSCLDWMAGTITRNHGYNRQQDFHGFVEEDQV